MHVFSPVFAAKIEISSLVSVRKAIRRKAGTENEKGFCLDVIYGQFFLLHDVFSHSITIVFVRILWFHREGDDVFSNSTSLSLNILVEGGLQGW